MLVSELMHFSSFSVSVDYWIFFYNLRQKKPEHTFVILGFIVSFRSVQIYNASCVQTEELLCFS